MTKRLIILSIALITYILCFANNDKKEQEDNDINIAYTNSVSDRTLKDLKTEQQYKTNRGYENNFEFSALFDLYGVDYIIDRQTGERIDFCLNTLNLTYIGGYRFNDFVFLGAGTGIDYSVYFPIKINYKDKKNENYLSIPLFARAKINFTKSLVSPYLSLDLGYSFLLTSDKFEFFESTTDGYKREGLIFSPTIGVEIKVKGKANIFVGFSYLFNYYKTAFFYPIDGHSLGVRAGVNF